ncbi:DUF427 domain-containing protein [Dongia sp.]|uniref:DUF427 domain-containing protein n=1 Tax=Dongia sp. TaxID=1977262 RepID=UPI003752300F
MSAAAKKIPGPDHPIAIQPTLDRVAVSFSGKTVADSANALTLREAKYAPVQYIPKRDVRMELLTPTAHKTYCPYKGDASYFSIKVGDRTVENAVWCYETPYDAVAEIAGHLAFYPDRVDSIEIKKAED